MTRSRRECRLGKPCEPTTLQEAIYCCVHHSAIAPQQIAERLAIRVTYLHDAANPDRDEHQFQARLLLPLMTATGNLAPLRFLNAALGRIDIPVPAIDTDGDDVLSGYLRLVREVGEDSALLERVMADGSVTPDEALRVKRETRETAEAAMYVAALVEQRVARPTLRRKARRSR